MSQDYFDLMNRPVFLHFLNREICETEDVQFSDYELKSIILMSILSTTSYVYIGHAIILEDMDKYPKTVSLLMKMEKYGYVCLVGNDFNINNFINRRRELYRYNKKKYSIYFQDNLDIIPWPKMPVLTNLGTTNILSETFVKIANDLEVEDEFRTNRLTERDKSYLSKRMDYQKRNKIAVTKVLFSRSRISREGKANIRRLIIQIYNKRYCNEFEGVYVTGIPGLAYYDKFQKTGFYYHYIVMREVLKGIGIFSDKFICRDEQLFYIRESIDFRTLLLEIRRFLNGVSSMKYSMPRLITFIRNSLNNNFKQGDSCENIITNMWNISSQLSKKYPNFKEGYDKMSDNYKKVLITSASVLEYRILRDCAKTRGYVFLDKDTNLDDFSYAECIDKGGIKIFLARTDMGGLNAAHTLELLNSCIHPDFVIVGGICVGLRKDEQKIGQILLSRQIHDYNLQKITDGKRILRGTTISANRYLYDKCILECYDMAEDEYDEGLILSANTLVNDKDLIQQMINDKPDAIGYEMEGSGVSYICNIFRNRWIMVKSISDWGVHKSNTEQEKSALKCYEFIFNMIENKMQI